MADVEICPSEYLERLYLDRNQFKKRVDPPDIDAVTKIISLKNMKQIQSIIPMNKSILEYIISSIQTEDRQKPFNYCRVELLKLDPRNLFIGQKFIYQEKIQNILEQVPDIFQDFCHGASGIGDLGAYFVFGTDTENKYCMALYIPPIIEEHGNRLIALDGVHRSYILKQAGSTINAVVVRNVTVPFPSMSVEWGRVEIIKLAERPENIMDRFWDTKPELFRDLKHAGIDG